MRVAFAHEALLKLAPDADPQAPGAAVTVALCGHWQHEGACRWPHRCAIVERGALRMRLRVVFAAEPKDEAEVRARIVPAVRAGRLEGPTGLSSWTTLAVAPAVPTAEEATLGATLAAKWPSR